MVKVKNLSVTIDGDGKFILLKSELDENFAAENLFHFADMWSCQNADNVCDLLAEGDVVEIHTPAGKRFEIDAATIGNETCGCRYVLIVCVDYEKSLHKVFGFSSEKDANTAYKMTQRYFELAHADEDADECKRYFETTRAAEMEVSDDAKKVFADKSEMVF